MKSFTYIVQDKVGIHARPANKLVQALSSYESNITIKFGDKTANAKSIINLMSLGLQYKSEIEFIADGPDEEKLIKELPTILEREGI